MGSKREYEAAAEQLVKEASASLRRNEYHTASIKYGAASDCFMQANKIVLARMTRAMAQECRSRT